MSDYYPVRDKLTSQIDALIAQINAMIERATEETEARLLEAMDQSSQERYCAKYPDRFFKCAVHWDRCKPAKSDAGTHTER
jgi:hypothetical protein